MDEFNQRDVNECIEMLSRAEDPDDAFLAWQHLQKKYSNLSAIVALTKYERAVIPSSIKKYVAKEKKSLTPYFSTEKLYFLDDELVSGMYSMTEFKFSVDYTLAFDGNIATYINKLVRGEPLGEIQARVVELMDDILHDGLNFDFLFYMVENVKNVLATIDNQVPSKIEFWRSLNREFRRNLVSLQIFRSIDSDEYKRTCNPRPQFSYRQAARMAIDFAYDFYASEPGRKDILRFVLLQRTVLLHLIGMVKIQLSSGKGAKYKINEYFKYVHEVVGMYFDREAVIAHKYFSDRSNVKILEGIKKGNNKIGLLKKLDNIAWDIVSPRFMEKLILSGGDGRYFIPMFVTFDSKLHDLLAHHPIKGVIFNKKTGVFAPIPAINTRNYFSQHQVQEGIDHLHSEPMKHERRSRARHTRQSVNRLILREYRLLRALI